MVGDLFPYWDGHRTEMPFKWNKFSYRYLSINDAWEEEREGEKEEVFLPFSL